MKPFSGLLSVFRSFSVTVDDPNFYQATISTSIYEINQNGLENMFYEENRRKIFVFSI